MHVSYARVMELKVNFFIYPADLNADTCIDKFCLLRRFNLAALSYTIRIFLLSGLPPPPEGS